MEILQNRRVERFHKLWSHFGSFLGYLPLLGGHFGSFLGHFTGWNFFTWYLVTLDNWKLDLVLIGGIAAKIWGIAAKILIWIFWVFLAGWILIGWVWTKIWVLHLKTSINYSTRHPTKSSILPVLCSLVKIDYNNILLF